MNNKLSILITTYKRTELALITIRALKKYLIYDERYLHWHLADDGSLSEHMKILLNELKGYNVSISNAQRRGVGYSNNLGIAYCLENGSEYILHLEDDWELKETFNVNEYIQVFKEYEDVGMIRLAYISPGLEADLIPTTNHRLWWKLRKGPQYTFVGHAALKTKKFMITYGKYPINLPPGQTELYMCGTFNNTHGPTVVVPAWHSIYGIFHHIGGESLKDIEPDK